MKGIPMVFGWAQDDGATNAGPAPSFQSEEDMKAPIKGFAHALTDDDYEQLFSLYQADDFEDDVRNYEARKSDADPIAPVHYFRIARIMRDLLFTCSSIDFGFELWKQSKTENPTLSEVRLYELNQSMITQLFHAAGMLYVGVAHGSDLDYIYNNMLPRDQMQEQDQQLSDVILCAFVNFAYTGNPNDHTSQKWPESFSKPEALSEQPEGPAGPSEIQLQVISGPWETGTGHLKRTIGDNAGFVGDEDGVQIPLVDSLKFGEMESVGFQERQQELEREKLLERCAFINSLAEKLGH